MDIIKYHVMQILWLLVHQYCQRKLKNIRRNI